MPTKLTKTDKTYFVDDGAKRGPMTMFRVRFHPTVPKLLALCVDRRVAVWDLNGQPEEIKKKKGKVVAKVPTGASGLSLLSELFGMIQVLARPICNPASGRSINGHTAE